MTAKINETENRKAIEKIDKTTGSLKMSIKLRDL